MGNENTTENRVDSKTKIKNIIFILQLVSVPSRKIHAKYTGLKKN